MKIEKEPLLRPASLLPEFDVRKLNFNDEGVKDFYWPLDREVAEKFGIRLTRRYIEIMRQYDSPEWEVLPYKIMGKYFVVEAVGILQADLLKNALLADGQVLNAPSAWRIWPRIFNDQSPEFPDYMAGLRTGPSKVNYIGKIFSPAFLKRVLRRIKPKKEGLMIDGLKIRPVTPALLESAIISTQRGELIVAHAANTEKEAVFCRSDRWFDEIDDSSLEESRRKKHDQIEALVMQSVEDIYAERGVPFKSYARDYLKSLLTTGAAMIRCHLDRLLANEKTFPLPHHLWTGSGGNVWDLMLRLAVMQRKGFVEAHDHGGGTGYVDAPIVSFIEFWACHKFYAYSEEQARKMRDYVQQEKTLNAQIPEFDFLPRRSNVVINDKFKHENPLVKKIVSIGTIYDGDRGRTVLGMPNVVRSDWQYRLFQHLKKSNYDVVLKHHPEGQVMPPDAFQNSLNVEVNIEPFERMMKNGDLFIFDYIGTSVFRSALCSNIPIIIIDFENNPWKPGVLPLIERRASMIKGWFDEKNRAQINWRELDEAIMTAPSKCNDTSFIDRFY